VEELSGRYGRQCHHPGLQRGTRLPQACLKRHRFHSQHCRFKFEMVIADNPSTDLTQKIAHSMSQSYDAVRLRRKLKRAFGRKFERRQIAKRADTADTADTADRLRRTSTVARFHGNSAQLLRFGWGYLSSSCQAPLQGPEEFQNGGGLARRWEANVPVAPDSYHPLPLFKS
jgi:hypothetical protein